MTGAVNNRRTHFMARTARMKVYEFSELSNETKEKVLDRMRFYQVEDGDWWDSIYDHFATLCKTIGVDVDLEKTYFSGFSSQGDGAGMTAEVDLSEFIAGINEKKYLDHAPHIEKEADYHPAPCTIDKRVLALIDRGLIDVQIEVTAQGRSYYTRTEVYIDGSDGPSVCPAYPNIAEQLDALRTWIEEQMNELTALLYRLLNNDYEYLTSDKALIEMIEANEYEFLADGRTWH